MQLLLNLLSTVTDKRKSDEITPMELGRLHTIFASNVKYIGIRVSYSGNLLPSSPVDTTDLYATLSSLLGSLPDSGKVTIEETDTLPVTSLTPHIVTTFDLNRCILHTLECVLELADRDAEGVYRGIEVKVTPWILAIIVTTKTKQQIRINVPRKP